MIKNNISHSFKYNNKNIKFEIGVMARQSSISILASMDDTTVLISISEIEISNNFNNFLPLTVNYYERLYSYGIIPNNIFNREIKQTENEILISRLIDRAVRSSFSNIDYKKELQITAIVLSMDKNVNPDIITILGVSASLGLIIDDFKIIYALRICLDVNGNFIINPNIDIYSNSNLNLVISGNLNSIIMIESNSDFIKYEKILETIKYSVDNKNYILENINIFINKNKNNNFNLINKKKIKNYLKNIIYKIIFDDLNKTFLIENKKERNNEIEKIKINLINKINNISCEYDEALIIYNFNNILKEIFRKRIITLKKRLDGRSYDEIRNIDIKIGLLSRTHGSCLFTKEHTQSLATITLGNDKNIDIKKKKFILHYNFLNYCFGEYGFLSFPKRREIGHGKLIYKSIYPIIPYYNTFKFTIRAVSEILESDGSSSMASVCSTSLALMDAGINIKGHVAGISLGVIFIDDNNYIILSDISGEEDNFGDIDIKIAGNDIGINSIQMDVKIIKYISINILENILNKAKKHILDVINKMNLIISKPNNLSKYSPIISTINIEKYNIKNLIGRGGNTIKKIVNDTGSNININDNGTVDILSNNKKDLDNTISKINEILFIPKIGKIYIGKIIKIDNTKIYIFIESIKKEIIIYNKNNNLLKLNQILNVKITNIDRINNKIIFNLI